MLLLKLNASQWLVLPAGLLVTENGDGTATFSIGGNTVIVSPPFIGLIRRQLTTVVTANPPPDPNNTWTATRDNM